MLRSVYFILHYRLSIIIHSSIQLIVMYIYTELSTILLLLLYDAAAVPVTAAGDLILVVVFVAVVAAVVPDWSSVEAVKEIECVNPGMVELLAEFWELFRKIGIVGSGVVVVLVVVVGEEAVAAAVLL